MELNQEEQRKIQEYEKKRKERQWFAVIGYSDRVEVMDGEEYRSSPPLMRSEDNPDGWVWVQAIDKSDAVPNAATAVYKATLETIPADLIKSLLLRYLEEQDWEAEDEEAKRLEELDSLLIQCGEESAFEGMTRIDEVWEWRKVQ